MIDPKERFSNRVDDYVRYRPGYPPSLFEFLVRDCGLGRARSVADVGSGTGILTRGLLEATAAAGGSGTSPMEPRVIAVEPNAAMRAAAEKAFAGDPRFVSSDGSAEATGLPARSVDLVVAAQAFHWFDPVRARAEFARIVTPGGMVALVWNQRSDTPLNRDYVDMLERLAPEYPRVRETERASEPKMRAFFAPVSPRTAMFENEQRLDHGGFFGRLLSSSYAPPKGHPLHEPIAARLEEIFRQHQCEGFVTVRYDTIVWYGGLE
jgi:SAM-dependent methyltransferase